MNWAKIKRDYPNIYEDIRELEKRQLHYDSRSLIILYLEFNNLKPGLIFIGALREANDIMLRGFCKI